MNSPVLPTTDLYFLNCCRRSVTRWWRTGPVERLGANSFACGDRMLLIRRDTPALMERAIAWPGTLVYLIDDDIDGAAQSPGLPPDYRRRLARFADDHFDRLLRRADVLAVSSDTLADRLRADPRVVAGIVRIDPFWAEPFADRSHFQSLSARTLSIAHLGTASHGGGLTRLAPAIIAVLDAFPQTDFTFFGGRGAHPLLESHPRSRRIDPMRWPRYQRWLPRQRFHLALYPLAPTAFDRARSCNKLLEHAIVGAAGIYPEDFPPATMLSDGAILAPSDPVAWQDRLFDAVSKPETLAARVGRTAELLSALDLGTAQRRIWSSLLGADLS
ncbi:hypothetical protein DMC47_43745 [Nostoc sp. 3335mG]|nr:hypothetical protein DMC47_43745 [Nostoc sp. 3335mG]